MLFLESKPDYTTPGDVDFIFIFFSLYAAKIHKVQTCSSDWAMIFNFHQCFASLWERFSLFPDVAPCGDGHSTWHLLEIKKDEEREEIY